MGDLRTLGLRSRRFGLTILCLLQRRNEYHRAGIGIRKLQRRITLAAKQFIGILWLPEHIQNTTPEWIRRTAIA